MAVLHRSAVGQTGHLGALYDFRSDSFQADSVFNSKLDIEDIYSTDLGETSVELLISDKLEDKFNKLDIEAELSVSILSGLVKVSGSGKFLDETRTTAKSSSMSLIYNVTTTTEEIYLRQLKKLVDLDALNTSEATHVLTSVDWGAVCTVTAEYEFSDEDEKQKIEGSLSAELNKLKGVLDVAGKAKVDYEDSHLKTSNKFKFFSKCDVSTRDQDLPVTFTEAVDQAKKLPSLVKATNNGKGVPLRFTLTPIKTVQKWFKQENAVSSVYKSIAEDSLKRIVNLAQNMSDTRQKLRDLQAFVKKGERCLSQEEQADMNNYVSKFYTEEAKFRGKLQELLKQIRSAEKEVSELDSLIAEQEGGDFSPPQVQIKLAEWNSVLARISFLEKAEASGIQYVGREEDYDLTAAKNVYIFFTPDLLSKGSATAFFWKLHRDVKDSNENAFFIVDHQRSSKYEDKLSDKIHHYSSCRLACEDIMARDGMDSDKCLVKMNEQTYSDRLPGHRAKLVLRCPLATTAICPADARIWLCSRCKCEVWYGTKKNRLHCERCQQSSQPDKATFRCNSEGHGLDFVDYGESLTNELRKLKPLKLRLAIRMREDSRFVEEQNGLKIYQPNSTATAKGDVEKYSMGDASGLKTAEKTIMVLGTTGAGKSTFLNSLVNYAFDVQHDDEFRFKVIDVDKNHNQSSAKSVTKKVTAYVLNETKLGFKLTIVDTPGFGDTDGLQEDKKTATLIKKLFESQGSSGVTSLNAACLVVKSTDTRLTASMRHNFNSVFQLFAKDMAQNVCVVATFCDASKPPVIETLKAHNINYKHLTKVNNSAFFEGLTTSDMAEKEAQAFYWKVGINGFDSFFGNVDKLPPVSLTQSAKVLRHRERLEELVQQIQSNIKDGTGQLETIRQEAMIIEKYGSEIASSKDFTYTVKEPKIEKKDISGTGQFTTTCLKCNFTCHRNCAIPNDSDKRGCCMMDSSGNCTACTCKGIWSLHSNVHWVLETRMVDIKKTSAELYSKYNTATSNKKKADGLMESLQDQFVKTHVNINTAVKTLRESIAELERIAAQPKYLTDVDYIDLLIQTEIEEAQPGWEERRSHLATQRDMAVKMSEAKDPNFDPFAEYKKQGWAKTTKQFKGDKSSCAVM